MSKPKRHHYLPQYYLRNFCREGKIWVFDRKLNEYRHQTPLNTALINNYYTYETIRDSKDAIIEKTLAWIESQTVPAFEKVLKRERITAEDKEVLSIYIGFLRCRIPVFEKSTYELYEKMSKQMNKKMISSEEKLKKILEKSGEPIEEIDDEKIRYLYEIIQDENYEIEFHRNLGIKEMLEMSVELAHHFLHMDWFFLCSQKNKSFIVTDNPFLLIPPKNHTTNLKKGVGIITPGAQKIIPISHNTVLLMLDRGVKTNYVIASEKDMRGINLTLTANCERFVFGRDKKLLLSLVNKTGISKGMEEKSYWELIS